MTVTAMTQRKMVADFTFIDAYRQVVATLKGYEAIVDESLMQAFKNDRSPSAIKETRP
jgi:hypothetical protein